MIRTSTENYIEILEKTNQQLSLWYNPYGLMIGILTLLVAILAIYFAYILWRQSKDYKDFLEKQKNAISEDIKSHAKKTLDEAIKKLIEDREKSTGAEREKYEKEINNLREVRESMGLTENQIQAIISLLQSFGAGLETVISTENIMRGKEVILPIRSAVHFHLSNAQVQAILSLLQTFGAKTMTIKKIEDILSNP